ncbi:MAG TPA: ferritin [Myxococcaceae bacterium]|nr:ferritin [Myxococcaceae bacterium]
MVGPHDIPPSDDVSLIRRVLARELETINEYEASARASQNPQVRAFFLHLAEEEKEHVAEAVHMLRLLDAGQEAHFARPVAEGHFEGAAPRASSVPVPVAPPLEPAQEPIPPLPAQRAVHGVPATPSMGALPLTVGSLRRSR